MSLRWADALDRARPRRMKKVFCSRRAAGAPDGALRRARRLACSGLDPLAATPPVSGFFAIFLSAAL